MGKFIVDHSTSNRLVQVWEDDTMGLSFEQFQVSKMPILDNTTAQVRLSFDGIDDHMTGSFPIPISTKDCTLTYIGKSTLPETGVGVICSFYDNNPENDIYYVRFGSIDGIPTIWYGNGMDIFETIEVPGKVIQSDLDYIWTFRSNGDVREFMLNGVIIGTSSVDLVSTLNSVQLGANGDNNYTEITSGGIIIYNTKKTSLQLNKINSFISNNYNIDIEAPTINDPIITTSNVTDSSITYNWSKATDNSDDSLLMYEVWGGDEQALSNLNTIKTQNKIAEGIDINTATIDIYSAGEFVTVAVLVRDPSGNEAIYNTVNELTLNPEINSITHTPESVTGDPNDTGEITWQVQSSETTSQQEEITVESSNVNVVTVSNVDQVNKTFDYTLVGSGTAVIILTSDFNIGITVEISVSVNEITEMTEFESSVGFTAIDP